jgi:hypothetical protein
MLLNQLFNPYNEKGQLVKFDFYQFYQYLDKMTTEEMKN